MNNPAKNTRIEYLDAVRAFALLLGIVFHASLSFMPMFIGWAVMDISTSNTVAVFLLISHSFRMELFFLIAGFFSHMTFHKRGAGIFINSRFTRIAIPFVLGWFLLRPLIVSSWVMGGDSMRGDVNILSGLKTGFESLGQLPADLLVGTHLWFLYYLLLITTLVLALRAVAGRLPAYSRILKLLDDFVAWLAASPYSVVILSIPTALCLWYMSGWGMDTPDQSLLPHWPVLFVYSGCFVLGWLLHRHSGLIEKFSRITVARLILAALSIVVSIILSYSQADPGHPAIDLIRAAFVLSYALMMWSLVFLSIGLFKRFFNKPRKSVRYIADSSYWLYLVHLPVVVWLQIAFAELAMHWSLKLVAISFLTVAISIILYDLFVRSTLIGQTLNQRRQDRVLFSRNR